MSRSLILLGIALVLLGGSCGRNKNGGNGEFPDNFNSIGDTERVAYMMKQVTPDSVARFICDAALGRVDGARIDSLGIATTYAYESYKGEDLDRFGEEYDSYVNSLPLADKMRMYAMAGVEDPQGLGLQLGLEYMQSIREKNLSVEDVEREVKAFKTACGGDSATYKRFIIGFRTVLEVDRGKDMPQDIYERFITLE